jgi:hypothetical protein
MGFACECGYAWKGTLPETRQHEGEYLSVIEREQFIREASEAIASLVEALALGQRDRWFDQSKYFNSLYPRDAQVAEVIHDLLSAIRMSKGVDVYRCPQCQRVYIQEQPETNWWLKYQYDKRIGTP